MRPTDRMPTAGKLVSAIGLAALVWYATVIVKAIWPVEESFGWFSEFAAAVGLLMGWVVMGKRLGQGYGQGIGAAWTALFSTVFLVVFLLSFWETMRQSIRLRYSGPFEAAQGMLDIAVTYVGNILYLPLIILLVGGAAVLGLVAEFIARRAG